MDSEDGLVTTSAFNQDLILIVLPFDPSVAKSEPIPKFNVITIPNTT